MNQRIGVLSLVLVAVLVLALPVGAQGPITPQHTDPTWQASYWNNTSLSGDPVLIRAEANIDHDWGWNAPHSSVPADHFSARWTKYIDTTAGTYRFSVTSDDGIRLWVDNQLLIDKWYIHPVETYTADKYLTAGHHLIRVEYFEETGLATAEVQWHALGAQQPPDTGNWRAEYYNNLSLSGTPALTRNEAAINYNWGTGSPQSGVVNADNFSVRWTQDANLAAGQYTFQLTVDDGARLWVNGHLLIDVWYEQAATTYDGSIYLPGGPVTIELQYFEKGGAATAALSWNTGSAPQPPTPPPSSGTVVVDDTDAGFVKGGASAGWRTVSDGYNGTMTWTYNNYSVQKYYNWARWYPSLAAGRYEVLVYIPHSYTTTSQARYWISHAGGYTLRIVNQSAYDGGQWVSLGTYTFRGNNSDYVSLSDVTYEAYRSRLIGFDAVKWEPR
jgi:hypothetical protein